MSANNASHSISLRMDKFSKAIGLARLLPHEDKNETSSTMVVDASFTSLLM